MGRVKELMRVQPLDPRKKTERVAQKVPVK